MKKPILSLGFVLKQEDDFIVLETAVALINTQAASKNVIMVTNCKTVNVPPNNKPVSSLTPRNNSTPNVNLAPSNNSVQFRT